MKAKLTILWSIASFKGLKMEIREMVGSLQKILAEKGDVDIAEDRIPYFSKPTGVALIVQKED